MVLMMASLSNSLLETYCNVLMVKLLDMMKASNWGYFMVKCLDLYL